MGLRINTMSEKRTMASLRIISTSIMVDDISSIMHQKPSTWFNKGDIIGGRGENSNKLREHTLWTLKSDVKQGASLDTHVEWFIVFLNHRLFALEELSKCCTFDLFCYSEAENGQGSIELPSALLKKLGDFKIDLIVDLYIGSNQ